MEEGCQYIQTRDGIKIFYRSVLPPNSKAVVIICHGYAEHGGFYVQFMEFLAEHGYGVYALDHRGHGYSEAERGHLERFEDFLEDLDFFVDFVRSTHPNLSHYMFGHSMGGLITFNYGVLYPEKLQGQIFSGPALDRPAGTQNIPTFLFKLLNIFLKRFKIRPDLSGKTTRNREARKISDRDPLVLRYATLGFFYQFACRGVAFAQENATCYGLPCLMLHGTDDRLVSAKVSERIFSRILSHDKTLKLYEGLYHELLQEPEQEMVLADILDWLDKQVHSRG